MSTKTYDYLDDWSDVKKKASEIAEAAQKDADNKSVTKDFVNEKISEYEVKDKEESEAAYDEINDRITQIVAGDGEYYTKQESDAKYADVNNVYTKALADEKFQLKGEGGGGDAPDLSEYAKIADVSANFQPKGDYLTDNDIAGKANVDDVYTKTVADDKFLTKDYTPDLSEYAKIDDVSANYQKKGDYLTSNDVSTKADADAVYTKDEANANFQPKGDYLVESDIADKADASTVYTKSEADAKYLTSNDVSTKVENKDFNALKNNIWIGDLSTGLFKTVYESENHSESMIWNESTGGGVMYTNKVTNVKSFTGVNDANDPNHVSVQLYAIDTTNNVNSGPRISLTKDGAYYSTDMTRVTEEYEIVTKIGLSDYAKTSEVADTYQPKGDYLTEHQSLEEYAKTTDVSSALDEKADANETINALESKANNSDLLIAKSECDMLKARVEYLEELIAEYLPSAKSEMINDGKIDDLDSNNTAVEILEPMKSVHLPEATVAYTVNVPLDDESTVEFTSNKYAYINNTSEEPVSVTFTRDVPESESASSSNATVFTTGQFDTITLENLSVSQKDTETNTVKNVVITENNQKTVSLTLSFADGAKITNDSSCPVTIMNKTAVPEDAEPISSTIVAPYSTVTVSGGQFNVLESTVSDDTLVINKAVHIKKLVVNKGNVVVKDYTLDGHIDEIEYADAEAASTYSVEPYTVDVYTKSDWSKASSTPGVYNVKNDIVTTTRIAPGLFGSSARIKLNGNTVSCSDSNGAFLLRGDSHYIIEDGTIDASAYGIWLSGPGIVELKNVTIIASAHALYIEKPNGQITTTGNCYFKVYDDDKRFVANYLDATYTGGWTNGFHFGVGTKFEDFDPMNSMGEPGGPVNLLDPGYKTVKTIEEIDGETHDIYTVVLDEIIDPNEGE